MVLSFLNVKFLKQHNREMHCKELKLHSITTTMSKLSLIKILFDEDQSTYKSLSQFLTLSDKSLCSQILKYNTLYFSFAMGKLLIQSD